MEFNKSMEFNRSKYKLFENSIEKVSKKIADLFNEIGIIKYNFHKPLEDGPTGHEKYDSYSNWGTNVVEPYTTYVGYEFGMAQRYLAVYIDEKYLSLPISKNEFLKLIEKHFGKFEIKDSKKDCKNSSYRVFIQDSWEINLKRKPLEELFDGTNNHIIDFSIIFNGDYKQDQEKYEKYLKSLPIVTIPKKKKF